MLRKSRSPLFPWQMSFTITRDPSSPAPRHGFLGPGSTSLWVAPTTRARLARSVREATESRRWQGCGVQELGIAAPDREKAKNGESALPWGSTSCCSPALVTVIQSLLNRGSLFGFAILEAQGLRPHPSSGVQSTTWQSHLAHMRIPASLLPSLPPQPSCFCLPSSVS